MSDVNVLSKKYKSLRNINDKLCDAVMLIKKRQLLSDELFKKQHPEVILVQEDWKNAYIEVGAFLNDIKNDNFESNYINYPSVKNLKDKIKKEIDLFDKKIITLVQNIQNEEIVTEEGFLLLNKLISILDSERSKTFRKLRTGRR